MREITQELQDSDRALIAMLGPEVPHRIWELKGFDSQNAEVIRRYVQTELSFFEKQEFINLFGGFIDQIVSGDMGIDIKQFFKGDLRSRINIPTDFSAEEAEKAVNENADMIAAVIKAIRQIPGLEKELFLIALGVPQNELQWAQITMTGPVVRGGLTDEQGFDILKTFIRQNAVAIRDFFAEKGAELVEVAQEELGEPESEESSETTDQTEQTTTRSSTDTPGGTPSSTTPPAPALTP